MTRANPGVRPTWICRKLPRGFLGPWLPFGLCFPFGFPFKVSPESRPWLRFEGALQTGNLGHELRANHWLTATSPRALPRTGVSSRFASTRSPAASHVPGLINSSSAQRALSARDRLNIQLSPLIAYRWSGVPTRFGRCFAVRGSLRFASRRPRVCGVACVSFDSRVFARSPCAICSTSHPRRSAITSPPPTWPRASCASSRRLHVSLSRRVGHTRAASSTAAEQVILYTHSCGACTPL